MSHAPENATETEAMYRLASAVQQIAQAHDLPTLVTVVCHAVRQLTGADGVTLVLRDGDHCRYIDEDAIGPLWKGQYFPLTSCISGWSIQHDAPAIVPDIYADPRIPHAAYRPTFVNSLCMVPIGYDSQIGAIGCYWRDNHCATPAEVSLQQALADATAVGITNIELYRQVDEARRLAEARADEAQRNAGLFRSTFEHAGTGIAHVSLDGHWLRVNQVLCDFLGYTHAEFMGLTFQDITYPPDLESDLDLVGKILAGNIDSYTMDKRYVRRDGAIVWASLSVTLAHKPDGQSDYFISVVRDINQLKKTEGELKEEREVFRSLANISAEYFWELDEHFRFRHISGSIGERTGVHPEEFMGKTRWEMSGAQAGDTSWALHRQCLESHQPFRGFQYGLPIPSGGVCWFEVSGDPVFSSDGAFKGYRGVTMDITARKAVEQKLRQHAMMFENSQEGIVITDPQGCVIDANTSFERITEYKLEEIIGKNMRILASGKQDRSFYLNMWQSIAGVGSWQGEIWNRRKSGEVYLEWISISAVKDEFGNIIAYVGTHTDIARMNHAQSEMERLAHHDALTGLPNRLLLTSRLEHALDRIKRGGSGAVLFLDLDGFKQVNDTYGHKAGDDLLIAVAQRLGHRLRDVDTLARFGGDEFVIVLEDIPERGQVAALTFELIKQLKVPFELQDGVTVHISGSVGVALFPEDGTDATQLIAKADQALYMVKHSGKGTCFFFSDIITTLSK